MTDAQFRKLLARKKKLEARISKKVDKRIYHSERIERIDDEIDELEFKLNQVKAKTIG